MQLHDSGFLRLRRRPVDLHVCSPLRSSQLAMKYLDPAFTSLTNALSEDLQNSSKWRHNSTAFNQQRSVTHSQTQTVSVFRGFCWL